MLGLKKTTRSNTWQAAQEERAEAQMEHQVQQDRRHLEMILLQAVLAAITISQSKTAQQFLVPTAKVETVQTAHRPAVNLGILAALC
jgi:hypothetical protein